VWKVNSEDLEPANLNYRICAIGFVLVAGQKPVMNAPYNDAAVDGCSECLIEVLRQMGDEMVAPSCTGLAEIQFKYRIGCAVFRYQSHRRSRTPTGSQPTSQPTMNRFDHKGLDMKSKYRRGSSVGSIPDGIIDVVGPIIALLDVSLDFVLREFVRERAFFVACDIPGAITEIQSTGGQRNGWNSVYLQVFGDPRVRQQRGGQKEHIAVRA
jgi:hypothetical protein